MKKLNDGGGAKEREEQKDQLWTRSCPVTREEMEEKARTLGLNEKEPRQRHLAKLEGETTAYAGEYKPW